MLKKTVLVRALMIAFSTAALTAAVAPVAYAQSNAAGTIFGNAPAGAGTSVVVKNLDTNLTRTVGVDASGRFQLTSMPIGRYNVSLMKGDAVASTTTVEVLAGQGVEAFFAATGVQSVEVTGRRSRIDVSNASNGATFTARELARLPIAKNVDAIIQLAPNTTRTDPTYAAGASFGGGGASENSYYINGFSVTNPLTQLGASELPFGAIAQASILTGGFGAEFGRSVGGVVNITGKSGTNTWEFGALASVTPARLRSDYRDYYYPNIGASNTTATDNTLRVRREDNKLKQNQYGIYVGGPIIKDKLFMFVSVEETDSVQNLVNSARTSTTLARDGWLDRTTNVLRYYNKFDWNLTDNHRLELTFIGDTPRVDSNFRSYNYTTRAVGTTVNSSTHEVNSGVNGANGAESQILRYTGALTDNFTVNALYGRSLTRHIYEPAGYNPNLFSVTSTPNEQAPGLNYTSGQSFAADLPLSGSTDENKQFRLDLEYKLGDHTVKFGVDDLKTSSLNAGDQRGGGGNWTYRRTTTPNLPTAVSGGSVPAIAGYGGLAAQGYYVERILHSTVSNAYSGQSAQYIEDRWQLTKNLQVTAGVRNEQFYNANQNHEKYIEQKNQIAPRFSASWDVRGDASLKVFGSAGRYTVPMPTVVALRGANGSLNTSQYFVYTGTDSNGLPTGLTQLTAPLSANNEYGQPKDPKTIASTNLKPSYQDELTLGFEQAFSPDLNFGAKITYRKLRSTIDDFCDPRPFDAYAAAHNINTDHYEGFSCASFNPGEDSEFLVDYAGTKSNYTRVRLTNADMGNFPKAKRVYQALDLYAEHPYRNGWYGRINYTLARNHGNTEGQTLSDTVTAQADVAATQTWDYAELMQYAEGLLPNDRRHQLKAFGMYDLTPEWTIGGNLLIASGRPRSCLGTHPNPGDSPNYNSASHYCFGTTGAQNVPSPRGSVGRLPWDKQLDINVVYKPAFLKDLSFKVDVFNVFNTSTVQKVAERYNTANVRYNLYEGVLSYTAPRAVKLSAEYNHKF